MSITETNTNLPVGTWVADTLHSSLGFALRHNQISTFRGRFDEFAATLDVAPNGEAKLTGTVQAASIAVEDPTLASHLAAPDFFDTERYPELSFRSSHIDREGESVSIEGELTIKGTTRPVTGAGRISDVVEDPFQGTRVALELEAVVDRRAYGLGWNMAMPDGREYLANDVMLTIALELTRSS
jgi:polyisoprenoid-binding protein YceI